ncbi:MAG: EamA family transporter [Clostridiales bacterium]|nr:EamA family transporter [Clostridiales bacterium]
MHTATFRHKATLTGFGAILLWGMLALLTSYCATIPPFQLTAMTFAIAFLAGAGYFIRTGHDFSVFKQPPAVWLNGVLGLFGYHALYFMALKRAPVVEASLINYLWPVLIVLFSAFLPGERLRWFHLAGVALGFGGVTLLLSNGGAFSLDARYLPGYALALACSVIWALYSVLSRKNSAVPTVLIGAFCGATAILSLLCHLLWEQTVVPRAEEWLPILLLGLGPVGLAFYTWDFGVKNGNIRLLGALSYAAPLLSSVLLLCFGRAAFRWGIPAACAFIIGGSLIASLDSLRSRAGRKAGRP